VDLAALHLVRDEDARARTELDQTAQLLRSEPLSKELDARTTDAASRMHLLHGLLHERSSDHEAARIECQAALDVLEPVLWTSFTGQRAKTYVQATRVVHGEEAVSGLVDRFRGLGYVPVTFGH
jgi:hypothetical protein